MAEGKTSPWVWIGCGCLLALVLIVGVLGGIVGLRLSSICPTVLSLIRW